MIDINYYNEIDDKYIDEEFLDENIPRDLYRLYSVQPYASQRNPSTRHWEVHMNGRRSKLYDYGKATYKVISADDAIEMVKRNKHEVQNLRIIFDGNLVEYEVRDNGSIYPIYRSPDPVFINGKTYKNVGFAPWQQIIRAADKIYWTDEYDKLISIEDRAKRSEKDAERVLYKAKTPDDPDYNPHKPYNNLIRGKVYKSKAIPDTGAHKNNDLLTNLYTNYDLARKALKKLENEKNTYEEEEYQELKTHLEAIKKQYLKEYEDYLKDLKNLSTKNIPEIPLFVHNFNAKIVSYTKVIQDALTTSYELKNKIDSFLTKTVNTDPSVSNDLKRYKTLLSNIITQLKDDNQEIEDSEIRANKEEDVEEIKRILSRMEEYKENYVNQHLAELASLENKLKNVNDTLAVHRPNTTARKARIAAANRKELDQELLDIIDFGDFSS